MLLSFLWMVLEKSFYKHLCVPLAYAGYIQKYLFSWEIRHFEQVQAY